MHGLKFKNEMKSTKKKEKYRETFFFLHLFFASHSKWNGLNEYFPYLNILCYYLLRHFLTIICFLNTEKDESFWCDQKRLCWACVMQTKRFHARVKVYPKRKSKTNEKAQEQRKKKITKFSFSSSSSILLLLFLPFTVIVYTTNNNLSFSTFSTDFYCFFFWRKKWHKANWFTYFLIGIRDIGSNNITISLVYNKMKVHDICSATFLCEHWAYTPKSRVKNERNTMNLMVWNGWDWFWLVAVGNMRYWCCTKPSSISRVAIIWIASTIDSVTQLYNKNNAQDEENYEKYKRKKNVIYWRQLHILKIKFFVCSSIRCFDLLMISFLIVFFSFLHFLFLIIYFLESFR